MEDTMAKPSIYPKEYRDQMAKECYEQLLENKTTIIQFSKENNIDTKCLRGWIQSRKNLWSWINSRYYKTESEISTSSFVKIEKAPVNIVIDYYGAKIQTNDNNLAYVLSAIKDAYTI